MKFHLASFRYLCRALMSACAVAVISSVACAAEKPAAIPKGPGSLTGIWQNAEYKFTGLPARERTLHTSTGEAPPLLPWAADLLSKRIADAEQGKVFANTLSECLPGGMPQMMFGAAYPVQIIETHDQITMLFEEQNHFRIIFLNAKQPDDPDPTYMGHSVGHWEGDTLVVDTIGLQDKTTVDMVGTPHTEALHVVEHIRRIAKDKLEVRVMLDDKGAFSKPWEAKTTYRPVAEGTKVSEYICENNRNAPDSNGFTGFK